MALQALNNVGFEVISAEDLAINDDKISWYYPLEGEVGKAQCIWDYFTVFRMTHFGKFFTRNLVNIRNNLMLILFYIYIDILKNIYIIFFFTFR